MKEWILCAAIWFKDGKQYEHQPINVEQGFVVSGRRHHDCYATLGAIAKAINLDEHIRSMVERIDRESQGFITNTNRFVDRKEGYCVARNAGQLTHNLHDKSNPTLISEDLY